MSTDLIRYDLLVQEALRGVGKRVLINTAKDGIQGDHHYYVTFITHAPGVRISTRMKEKYPHEMTIVLQHQFWDLAITEHSFEVGLAFGGIPERLLVPFEAVNAFYDPSVQFGLKFEVAGSEGEADIEGDMQAEPETASVTSISPKSKASRSKIKVVQSDSVEPQKKEASKKLAKEAKATSAELATVEINPDNQSSEDKEPENKQPATKENKPTADVVSLDAFRKKS
jgi:uncharacterized protein